MTAGAGRATPRQDGESEYDRLAVTMPRGLARKVRRKAEAGEARSVSAYITQAVEEKLERDDLKALLREMAEEFGPPTPEQKAWADDILAVVAEGLSPSMPEP